MPGVMQGYSVRRPSFNAYDNADPWVRIDPTMSAAAT